MHASTGRKSRNRRFSLFAEALGDQRRPVSLDRYARPGVGQQSSLPSTPTPPDRGGREQQVERHRSEAPDINADIELPRQWRHPPV